MRRLRLAVFTNEFPSRVSTFFARDMRALLEAGLDLDIFALYPPNPAAWRFVPRLLGPDVLSRERVHHASIAATLRSARPWPVSAFASLVRHGSFPAIAAARFGFRPVAKTLYSILQARLWAERYPEPYDHVLSYWGNYAATCAYVFHQLVSPLVPFSLFLHAGTDLYRDQVYLARKLCYADNVILVCEYNRQYLYRRYPQVVDRVSARIHIHHLGLNLAEFEYAPTGRPRARLLGVGTLHRIKGFDRILLAAAKLRCRGVDVEVDLVGDGPERENLAALARQLGIDNLVTFRGHVPPEEVPNAMRGATILVHPSREHGDAVPTVIKEALALGTPVVAFDVAGIPELLDFGRCGVLVPAGDVEALAGAIESLLGDPAARARYATAGRRHAQASFDLWRNGRALADRLRQTVRHAAAGP